MAEKYDLEGQLYEGGALEKVLHLIGRDRQCRSRNEMIVLGCKKEEWANEPRPPMQTNQVTSNYVKILTLNVLCLQL